MKPLTSRLSNERIEELLGFVKSGKLEREKIQSYVNDQARRANSGPDKANYPWFPVAEAFEDLAEAFDALGIFIYSDSDPELIIGYKGNDPLNSSNS